MQSKYLAALIILLLAQSVALAETYQIRVANNTNLRESYSLDSAVLASARAGSTLEVVGQHNRWLQISRDGRTYWMASWVAYTRVDGSLTAPATDIDNCCYVDRQCVTNQEWVEGFHAYQRNECAVGTTNSQPISPQPATGAPATIDNCCFAGWQCHTSEEWRNGYHAYQNNQCASPNQSATAHLQIADGVNNCCQVNQECVTEADWVRGWVAFRDYRCDPAGPPPESRAVGVEITGNAGFREQMVESLLLMRRRARFWYDYTVKVLNRIVQTFSYEDTYVDTMTGIFYLDYDGTYPRGFTRHEHLVFTASILVHEACHIYREQAGLESGGLVGERACTEKQLAAHVAIDPNDSRANEHRETLATIHDPSTWWW